MKPVMRCYEHKYECFEKPFVVQGIVAFRSSISKNQTFFQGLVLL